MMLPMSQNLLPQTACLVEGASVCTEDADLMSRVLAQSTGQTSHGCQYHYRIHSGFLVRLRVYCPEGALPPGGSMVA